MARRRFPILILLILALSVLTVSASLPRSAFPISVAPQARCTIYAGVPTVTNIYDAGGNLLKVQHVSGTPVYFQSKGYNELGQLVGINFGNGTEATYAYFAKTRRLQTIASKLTAAATNFQSLAYVYNEVADLSSITDSIFATGTNSATLSSIAYDNLHRLISLTRPGPVTTTFSYDRIGNVTGNGEEGASGYVYNSNGLLAHAVKAVGTKKYAYDLCGNMVYRNGQALGYDPENRLASVIKNGLAVATFGYSDDRERLWKQGTNTLQVWLDKVFEARGTTNLYHIFAGTRRVATFSPAVKLPGASGNTDYHYYHGDHLGSSSLITDATGAMAEHYEYTAYGRERANGSAAPDGSHRFTGQILDQDTGLYYYGARYYDAVLARFVQPDTIIPSLWNPQSYNRYAYTLNNPLRYTDPSGQGPLDWVGSFFDYSGPTYLGPGPNARPSYGPLPNIYNIADPNSQAGQRQAILGNAAWDTSRLEPVREGVAFAAKLNPIYRAHEGISGVDSTENNRTLGTFDKMEAVADAATSTPAKKTLAAAGIGLTVIKASKAAKTAETLPGKLYHYTGAGNAERILQNGLGAGGRRTFATPAGNLSPVQAQIELALPANRGYPGALFEIDTARLQQLGINPAVGPQRIMSTPNAGGGGIEFIFNQPIPPSAIRQVPFP